MLGWFLRAIIWRKCPFGEENIEENPRNLLHILQNIQKKTISFRKLPIYNKKPMSLRKGIGFCQQSGMDVITHPFNQILFFSSLNASKSSPTISEISSSVWLFLTSILIAILICVFFHHAQCLVWYPTGFLCLLILQTFHLMLCTLLHLLVSTLSLQLSSHQ